MTKKVQESNTHSARCSRTDQPLKEEGGGKGAPWSLLQHTKNVLIGIGLSGLLPDGSIIIISVIVPCAPVGHKSVPDNGRIIYFIGSAQGSHLNITGR